MYLINKKVKYVVILCNILWCDWNNYYISMFDIDSVVSVFLLFGE